MTPPPMATAVGATLVGPGAWPHMGFLRAFAKSGALAQLDGFSLHPYRHCQWPELGLPLWAEVRAMLDAEPGGEKVPLVASEWGYSSLYPTPAMRLNDGGMPSRTGCNEDLQVGLYPIVSLSL